MQGRTQLLSYILRLMALYKFALYLYLLVQSLCVGDCHNSFALSECCWVIINSATQQYQDSVLVGH